MAQQNGRLIALLEKQHATLDRVVAAKFDTPLHGRVTEQRTAEPVFPQFMMADVLNSETDAEFFEKAESLTQ